MSGVLEVDRLKRIADSLSNEANAIYHDMSQSDRWSQLVADRDAVREAINRLTGVAPVKLGPLKREDAGREITIRAKIGYPGSRVSDILIGEQVVQVPNDVLRSLSEDVF